MSKTSRSTKEATQKIYNLNALEEDNEKQIVELFSTKDISNKVRWEFDYKKDEYRIDKFPELNVKDTFLKDSNIVSAVEYFNNKLQIFKTLYKEYLDYKEKKMEDKIIINSGVSLKECIIDLKTNFGKVVYYARLVQPTRYAQPTLSSQSARLPRSAEHTQLPRIARKNEQRSEQEQHEIDLIWEKLKKGDSDLNPNDVIDNFLNYIYTLKNDFIKGFISYLDSYRDSLPEKTLFRMFLETRLIDYDNYLRKTYFEKRLQGVSEELKDKLVDFIDILCSPEFMQKYIESLFEKYKVFKIEQSKKRIQKFNDFLEMFCIKNKPDYTREYVLNFADEQKKSERSDIIIFLINNDDKSSLKKEYDKYLKESPKMNDLETKLQAMITIFNSYKIVEYPGLTLKQIYFSVLKKIYCQIDWNKSRTSDLCYVNKGVFNNIILYTDKFNKLYKEYKKIRYSNKREDSGRFDNIIKNLIKLIVDLQKVIDSSVGVFDDSAKTKNITEDSKSIIRLADGLYDDELQPVNLPQFPEYPESHEDSKQKVLQAQKPLFGDIRSPMRLQVGELPSIPELSSNSTLHSKQATSSQQSKKGGGKPPPKYKSTGRIVCIIYKKRKYKRTVYVKDKRNTKYCKIDGEYILLSKMKMIA